MQFNEIVNYLRKPVVIERECNFDGLFLFGKPRIENLPVISYILDSKYVQAALDSNLEGLICTAPIAEEIRNRYDGGICISENPKTTFFEIHNALAQNSKTHKENKISSSAMIHKNATIAERNVIIGENVRIAANVTIYEGVIIGDNVVIMENSVIGTPGFYYFGEGDERRQVEPIGNVVIEDNAEIHTNVVIEKSVFGGSTIVGKNTKLAPSVVLSHDVKIGKDCIVAASSCFGGWTIVGDNSNIGIGAFFAPGLTIGNNTKLSIGAVVTKDVPDNSHFSGNFAIEHSTFLRNLKNSL